MWKFQMDIAALLRIEFGSCVPLSIRYGFVYSAMIDDDEDSGRFGRNFLLKSRIL